MNEWAVFAILSVFCILGTMLTALRLPGTWLILVAAVVYLWRADWPAGAGVLLAVLGGAAIFGEVVETLASIVLARRGGASRYATWGGVAGGFLGAIFLSFIPIFPIGTIMGALLGCFLGAAAVEVAARKRLAHGTRVGVLSAIGFAVGMATKVAVALAMSTVLLVRAWPSAS